MGIENFQFLFFNWQKKNKNLKTSFSLGVQITQMKLNILFSNFKLLVICKKEITIKQKGDYDYERF